ncbi:hypothetical protein BD770DRAFT_471686 [Pilaira anomala]|nr:hypothetical protein BD770DRAFT_471686 [Pilaira anomala]
MDKVYNLHQHTHCAIIYMGETDIVISCCSSLKRVFGPAEYGLTDEASVTYNKQRTKVLGWSHWDMDENNEDQVKIDNFMEGIYQVFQKDESNRNKDDLFLIQAMSDLLRLAVEKVLKDAESVIENLDALHYVFVVPSEWEEGIRNDLIRPIFFRSGLIAKDDHSDRLLFFSDIETIFYELQDSNKEIFQRGQHTLLCKVTAVDYEKTIIQLNLIQTWNPLFDIPNSKLFPRVIRSITSVIGAEELKTNLKLFLRSRLFPVSASIDQIRTIEVIAGDIFNSVEPEDMDTEDEEEEYTNEMHASDKLMVACVTDTSGYGLNEAQTKFLKSLCVLDICQEISQTLFNTMKNISSYNSTKEHKLLILRDLYYSELDMDPSLFEWIKYVFEYNRRILGVTITNIELKKKSIERDDVISGAGFGVMQNIRNSDMHSEPHILPTEKLDLSSSAFGNSGLDAILSIDISSKSTSLLYSLLNDDGSVEKIFKTDHFMRNKSLPHLEEFYTFSDITTLNVKEEFISFAENHILDSLTPFSTKYKDLLLDIEYILNNHDSIIKEVKVSTQQTKYIKAFLLMYIVYLKEIISTSMIGESKFGAANLKIGYAVYIEKRLLDNIVGTKEELKSLIFESGLIQKDDKSKRLNVITQGEMILLAIQKYLRAEFPLKTYFLVTQVYENYIQLTLNQVITGSTGESKEQETIVIQDEILSIQNIYSSLSLNLWNSIIQNHSFIQFCPKHNEGDENLILELFSLKTKTELMKNLNKYISDNTLTENPSYRKIDKVLVQMNTFCLCKVCLTEKDIIEIAFKPMLQEIASLVSASLINKNLFGNYTDIQYLVNFMHFNNNTQLKNTLTCMLNDELDCLNLDRGVDLHSLTLPESPNQLLQPILFQRPFLYRQFQFGTLKQVVSDNYAISLYQDTRGKFKSSYKNIITDTESIEFDDDNAFPLLKKGDVIRDGQFNRVFYLDQLQYNYGEELLIRICKFKTFDKLRYDGTASLEDDVWERLYNYVLPLKSNDINADGSLPLLVSVRYQAYSSSLQFLAKVVGSDFSGEIFEAGEPLTLNRV